MSDDFDTLPDRPGDAPIARSGDRRPPYNEEAERAVLSACMLDAKAIRIVQRLGVTDEAFYREAHRRIYRAMVSLADAGAPLEVLAVADRLGRELPTVGGKDYLAELIDAVPTAANVGYHAQLVREAARRRQVIEACTSAAQLAYENETAAAAIVQGLTANLVPLAADDALHVGYQRVDPGPVLEIIERRMVGERVQAYPCGIHAIDEQTNGYRPGELIIIGAVPKAGKSVLAHQIALRHAETGQGVGIVSAELQAAQAIERMLNNLSGVTVRSTTRGHIARTEMPSLLRAASRLRAARLWIDDAATPSWDDVRVRAIGLKAENPDVTMLVVDFLQLVRYQMRGRRGDEELTAVAYGLKGLAKQLGVVMVVPCQLNYKDIEKRPDKRPELQDLQGSSGMVQAADQVILLYRPGMYFPESSSTIELIVPAGGTRRTPAFTATCYWRGDTMRIANEMFDPDPEPEQRELIPA